MKIIISGKDRTGDVGAQIVEDAARRAKDPRCAFLPWSTSALSLRDEKCAPDYLDRFLLLLRSKTHVGTLAFDIPRRPGLMGHIQGAARAFLWRVLRYQHDRLAFRQNVINTQLASALEFERAESKKLAERIAALEKKSGS